MTILLFILLLTTTISHALKSMEPAPTDLVTKKDSSWLNKKVRQSRSDEIIPSGRTKNETTAKIKQRRHFKKTSSLSSIDENKIVKTPAEHGLITAVRNKNLSMVKFYLQNPYLNPNVTNAWGNTALHYAAMFKLAEFINIFLADPRIDASIKNKYHLTAQGYITGETEEDRILHKKIFAKASVNMVVTEYARKIKSAYTSGNITLETIEETVEILIKKTKADQERQKEDGRPIPDAAQYPDYATPEFVKEMLLFLLANN